VVGVVSRVHDQLGHFVHLPFQHSSVGRDLPAGLAPRGFVDVAPDGRSPILGQTVRFVGCLASMGMIVYPVRTRQVVGRVTRVDVDQKRFKLSLKTADCAPTKGLIESAIDLLASTFDDDRRIRNFLAKSSAQDDPRRALLRDEVQLGRIVECVVDSVTEFGLICSLECGLKGRYH